MLYKITFIATHNDEETDEEYTHTIIAESDRIVYDTEVITILGDFDDSVLRDTDKNISYVLHAGTKLTFEPLERGSLMIPHTVNNAQ